MAKLTKEQFEILSSALNMYIADQRRFVINSDYSTPKFYEIQHKIISDEELELNKIMSLIDCED